MSWAFPKELLAKSGIAPIMCARSRASKLDVISAKTSVEVLCRRHAGVPGWSPSHSRATLGRSGGARAAGSQHWGCPRRQGVRGRDEKSPLWGLEALQQHF